MNFAVIIKNIRTKLILTQEELAEKLGVSFASINRWENGHFEPTTKIKRKIIEFCCENGFSKEEVQSWQ